MNACKILVASLTIVQGCFEPLDEDAPASARLALQQAASAAISKLELADEAVLPAKVGLLLKNGAV